MEILLRLKMGGSGTTKQEILPVPVCRARYRQATGHNTPEENERGYSPREITLYLTG